MGPSDWPDEIDSRPTRVIPVVVAGAMLGITEWGHKKVGLAWSCRTNKSLSSSGRIEKGVAV